MQHGLSSFWPSAPTSHSSPVSTRLFPQYDNRCSEREREQNYAIFFCLKAKMAQVSVICHILDWNAKRDYGSDHITIELCLKIEIEKKKTLWNCDPILNLRFLSIQKKFGKFTISIWHNARRHFNLLAVKTNIFCMELNWLLKACFTFWHLYEATSQSLVLYLFLHLKPCLKLYRFKFIGITSICTRWLIGIIL